MPRVRKLRICGSIAPPRNGFPLCFVMEPGPPATLSAAAKTLSFFQVTIVQHSWSSGRVFCERRVHLHVVSLSVSHVQLSRSGHTGLRWRRDAEEWRRGIQETYTGAARLLKLFSVCRERFPHRILTIRSIPPGSRTIRL